MIKIFRFFVLLLALHSYAQEQFMVVNPIGHRGHIHDLAISKDQRYVITAGFDKTIKKWDLSLGEVVMEYRSEMGLGSEGIIYFVELSPDNSFLAVGGWFGNDEGTENLGDIRIFDFQTGKMIRVLKGLTAPPEGLHITSDNKYVIAGDNNNNMYKWDVSTGEQVAVFQHPYPKGLETLTEHTMTGEMLWSLDDYGYLYYWNINNPKKPVKSDKKSIPEVYKLGFQELDQAENLAISPTLEDYALSIENFIVLFDKKQKFYFLIDNKTKPGFLRFSPDGKRLMTGCSTRGSDIHAFVYEKQSNGDWKEIADFAGADASLTAGDFLDNNTCITAGGMDNYIYIWSIDKDANGKQKMIQTLTTNGLTSWAAGLNDGVVAISDAWTSNFGKSTFTHEFDLFLKSIVPISNAAYNRPDTTFGDWTITWARGGKGQTGLTRGLKIMQQGKAVDTLIRDETNGLRHEVFSFSPNGFIVSGGEHGFVEVYTTDGRLMNRLVGHTGLITGISFSPDSSRMITSADDNTIRIWDAEKIGVINDELKESVDDYLNSMDKYPEVQEYIRIFINRFKLNEDAKKRSAASWTRIIQMLVKKNEKGMAELLLIQLNKRQCQFIYPIVSIFLTKDHEWIVWDEAGYFSASKKGARYVGYHVNKGRDKEAVFYPFEQFDLKYNRPDIILKDLGLGSDKIRDFYYRAYLKRLSSMGMTEAQLAADLNVPTVQITSHTVSPDRKQVTLHIRAADDKVLLDRIQVYLNDVPVFGKAGIPIKGLQQLEKDLTFDLADEKNKIQVSVLNQKGLESLRENLYVFNPKSTQLPNLYVISIGTSAYLDKRFNLKYAAKDAKDVVAQLSSDQQFGSVFHEILTDQQSTRENIIKLKAFIEKAGRNDVVLVFIAGHGLLDEKLDYYYATYDIDFNDPGKRGLLYGEIEELLDGIKALKKLLFMDTCHSGEVDKDEIEKSKQEKKVLEDVQFRNAGQGIRKKTGEGLASTSELVKELFTDLRRGTGATIIASAGGVEFAMESDAWKNGLFTYCLLNGISSMKADLNQDGKVMLSELQQFLGREVKLKSGGRQQPTSRQENITLDYPLWSK